MCLSAVHRQQISGGGGNEQAVYVEQKRGMLKRWNHAMEFKESRNVAVRGGSLRRPQSSLEVSFVKCIHLKVKCVFFFSACTKLNASYFQVDFLKNVQCHALSACTDTSASFSREFTPALFVSEMDCLGNLFGSSHYLCSSV